MKLDLPFKMTKSKMQISKIIILFLFGINQQIFAQCVDLQSERFDFISQSVQTYEVPSGVTSITIQAVGAQGGAAGGAGASMQGDFDVTPGQMLSVIVGEQGASLGTNGSGGGGSGVVDGANLLIVAGGGGGADFRGDCPDWDASITTSGNNGSDRFAQATFGAGGTAGADGGTGTWPGTNGIAPGGKGWNSSPMGSIGDPGSSNTVFSQGSWGLGGGGGATGTNGGSQGGGGGGYSGGGGGSVNSCGGGGGSFNSGANPDNSAGVNNAGNGYVIISYCADAPVAPIPTMGQWSLFILALLMSSLGLVFIKRRTFFPA